MSAAADGPGATDDAAVDLLAEISAALAGAPSGAPFDLTGYCEAGPHLSLNLTGGHLARLAAAPGGGVAVESDWPAWISFEGWLPPGPVQRLRVSLAAAAERDFWADLFVRSVAPDGAAEDSPAARLTLGDPAAPAAEALLSVPPEDGRRRKLVVLLPRPPAHLVLHRLTLTPAA